MNSYHHPLQLCCEHVSWIIGIINSCVSVSPPYSVQMFAIFTTMHNRLWLLCTYIYVCAVMIIIVSFCVYSCSGPALLRSYRNVIAYVMHLLYEDMKLSILYNANLEEMATLLHHITRYVQCICICIYMYVHWYVCI